LADGKSISEIVLDIQYFRGRKIPLLQSKSF